MKRVTQIATACFLAVLVVVAARVGAQDFNAQERTFLTFSSAVELPGVTLQPGTYVFRLADTPSRNVVQVLTQDEKDILGQWLFVQAERPEVSQENVVMFKESPEGTTPAVQFWYYPGERIGKEFVYPKNQAMTIAQRTGVDVLSSDGEISGQASVSSVDAQGNVTPWEKDRPSASASAETTLREAPSSSQPTAPAGSLAGNRGVTDRDRVTAAPETDIAPAPEPEPEPAVTARADPQSTAVGTSGRQDDRFSAADELPRTASPLPLSGLIGLLSLAGAVGIRMARR